MCNCTDEAWIGQPDSQRTVDVEGDSCIDSTGTSSTLLGLLSVRRITGSTYEKRAVETTARRDVSLQSVVRMNE